MKLTSSRHKLTILLATIILFFSFQNCSQNGAIALESPPDASNSISPDGTTPDGNSASGELQYINQSKTINVAEDTNKVDVLVVIDNSGSMAYEQINMADRFGTFLDQLQGLDWQVGIVTTDVTANTSPTTDGKLLQYAGTGKKLISSSDNIDQAKTYFANTIQRSEVGSGAEQGIKASVRALQRAANTADANSALIRANSALSIIVVTDGNESSTTAQNQPSYLLNLVTQTYPGKSFKFHSIIVKTNDSACLYDRSAGTLSNGSSFYNSNEKYGTSYTALTQQTNGIIGSVCEQDYGSQLSEIGKSTSEQVKQTTLDCAPVDADKNGFADIEIRNAQTNALITNYTVSGLQINFDQPLAPGQYSLTYICVKK